MEKHRPQLLFIIDSDPRKSGRPAEAIRVAAGVSAWKKVDITVYLRGPALLALGEWLDELVDEDNYTRYLPLLAEGNRVLLVPLGAKELDEIGEPSCRVKPIDDIELAAVAARSTSVLRF